MQIQWPSEDSRRFSNYRESNHGDEVQKAKTLVLTSDATPQQIVENEKFNLLLRQCMRSNQDDDDEKVGDTLVQNKNVRPPVPTVNNDLEKHRRN